MVSSTMKVIKSHQKYLDKPEQVNQLIIKAFSQFLCRITDYYGVWINVVAHYTVSTDNCSITDVNTRKNYSILADPHIVANYCISLK